MSLEVIRVGHWRWSTELDVGGCRTELDVGGDCGSWVSKVANGVGCRRLLPELAVGVRVKN